MICPTCHGSRQVAVTEMVMGFPTPMTRVCPDCAQDREMRAVREVFGDRPTRRVDAAERWLFVKGDVADDEDWERLVDVHERLGNSGGTDVRIVLSRDLHHDVIEEEDS